jgi:hypothetical protein
MIRRRGIEGGWIEETLRSPAIERQDPNDGSLTQAFRRIPESGDRWLRVVYRMENQTHVVITAFFDRNQERRR